MIQKEWDAALHALPPLTLPENFLSAWQERKEEAERTHIIEEKPFLSGNEKMAAYSELSFAGTDGDVLKARYIRPVGEGKHPLVLLFHAESIPVRGWHYMTRFIALDYAVFALENRKEIPFEQQVADALCAAQIGFSLPHTDKNQVFALGDSLGGTLAIAVSAFFPVAKCVAQNPLACVDDTPCACFASLLHQPFLMATSGMDVVSPPETQVPIYAAVPEHKKHFLYPKYIHERINHFEDQTIVFLHPSTKI